MKKRLMNRRNWLKTSTGLMAASSFVHTLHADEINYIDKINPKTGRWITGIDPDANIKARINSNENPWGPSEKAKNAYLNAFSQASRYPDFASEEIKERIAKVEGVKAENVFICAGLSELLNLMADLQGVQKGTMVSAHPTFDLMPALAAKLGGKWIKVPVNGAMQHDLIAMQNAITPDTKLVYICNPGNPTATIVNPNELSLFIDRNWQKSLIFIDEAYNDYIPFPASHTMISKIREGKDILIGKTLSKVHGFAGLRMAYAIGSQKVISELNHYRPWAFGVSGTAYQAAMISLEDKEHIAEIVKRTNEIKSSTIASLQAMGYKPILSYTNFVMFPIQQEGSTFVKTMADKGVDLRSWNFNNQNYCRVSIGTREDMDLFLSAMKSI